MNQWKVHHRLLSGFAVLILLLLGLSLYSIAVTRDINASFNANATQHSVIQRAAVDFRGSVHDRAIALRDAVLAPSAQDLAGERALIAKLERDYRDADTRLQQVLKTYAALRTPAMHSMLEDIARIEQQGLQASSAILQALEQGDTAHAQQTLWQQAKPQYTAWLASINRLIDAEEALIKGNNQLASSASTGFASVMMLATLLGILLSTGAAWFLARSITRELGAEPFEVRQAVQALQQGDLTVHVPVKAGDQSSIMADVHALQQRFHTLVAAVHVNIGRLRSTGSDISDGNHRLGERTTQTTHSLAATTQEMQALTQAVHASFSAATQAEQRAGQALAAASEGGNVMQQVVSTMRDIEQSSRHIEEIIGVIDGIAFQTNILALNAAVEAARAGEQGRGFAVVAAEVRSLAGRSAEAAKQIKQLIGNSVARIDSGAGLVEQAGSAMQDIVAQVQQVHRIITSISQASEQQNQGIAQMHVAVGALEQMTQQNAALVHASSAAASQLETEAQALQHLAAAFTVQSVQHALAAPVPARTVPALPVA